MNKNDTTTLIARVNKLGFVRIYNHSFEEVMQALNAINYSLLTQEKLSWMRRIYVLAESDDPREGGLIIAAALLAMRKPKLYVYASANFQRWKSRIRQGPQSINTPLAWKYAQAEWVLLTTNNPPIDDWVEERHMFVVSTNVQNVRTAYLGL